MNFIDKVKKFVIKEKVSCEQIEDIMDSLEIIINLVENPSYILRSKHQYKRYTVYRFELDTRNKGWDCIEVTVRRGFVNLIVLYITRQVSDYVFESSRVNKIRNPSLDQVNEMFQKISDEFKSV